LYFALAALLSFSMTLESEEAMSTATVTTTATTHPTTLSIAPDELPRYEEVPPASTTYTRRHSSPINDLIEDETVGLYPADSHPSPHDEELPDYETTDLPSYDDDRLQSPSSVWRIYQITKNLQRVTEASGERCPYRIVYRSSPAMFSKKADMTLHKLPKWSSSNSTASVDDSTPGTEVASMAFDRGNRLPWMPRANITYPSSSESQSNSKRAESGMAAPNFNDWKFAIGGKSFSWNLGTRPASLILLDRTAKEVAARFIYSRYGTDATKGAEVGTLEVYSGYGDERDDGEQGQEQGYCGAEWILASLCIAIAHWKGMGRHYRNLPDSRGTAGGDGGDGRRASATSTMIGISNSLNARGQYSVRPWGQPFR
jgi:hypothetical protein